MITRIVTVEDLENWGACYIGIADFRAIVGGDSINFTFNVEHLKWMRDNFQNDNREHSFNGTKITGSELYEMVLWVYEAFAIDNADLLIDMGNSGFMSECVWKGNTIPNGWRKCNCQSNCNYIEKENS